MTTLRRPTHRGAVYRTDGALLLSLTPAEAEALMVELDPYGTPTLHQQGLLVRVMDRIATLQHMKKAGQL